MPANWKVSNLDIYSSREKNILLPRKKELCNNKPLHVLTD